MSVLSIPISEGEKLANTIVDSLSKGNVQKFLGEKLGPVVGTLKGTFSSLLNSKYLAVHRRIFIKRLTYYSPKKGNLHRKPFP